MQNNKTYFALDFINKERFDTFFLSTIRKSTSNITIENAHSEASLAIRAYVNNRMQKIHKDFEKIFDATFFILIDNTVDKVLRHSTELKIHLKDEYFYTETRGEDLYLTIDSAIENISKQKAIKKATLQF